MSAFNRGFALGNQMVNDIEEARRMRARDAREQTRFEAEQADRQARLDREREALGVRAAALEQYTGVSAPLADSAPSMGLRPAGLGLSMDSTPTVPSTGLRMPGGTLPTPDLASASEVAPAAPMATGIRARASTSGDLYTQRPTRQIDDDLRPQLTALKLAHSANDNALFLNTLNNLEQTQNTRNINRADMEFAQRAADPNSPEAKELRRMINVSTGNLVVKTDPKTGMSTFELTNDSDPVEIAKVRPDQMMVVARAARMIQRGEPEGITMLAGVNKDLANAVMQDMDRRVRLTQANNETVERGNRMANDNIRTRNDGVRTRAAQAASQLGRVMEVVGDDGQRRLIELRPGSSGATASEVTLPQGLRLPQAKNYTNEDVLKFVDTYGDTPVRRVDGRRVTLRELPPAEQRAEAVKFFSSQGGKTDLERAAERDLAQRNAGGQPAPASPAAQQTPLPVSTGQTRFGILTPMSVIEREAAAGNPYAQEALARRRQVEIDRELYPLHTGVPVAP